VFVPVSGHVHFPIDDLCVRENVEQQAALHADLMNSSMRRALFCFPALFGSRVAPKVAELHVAE
jgi:hypothetical protein